MTHTEWHPNSPTAPFIIYWHYQWLLFLTALGPNLYSQLLLKGLATSPTVFYNVQTTHILSVNILKCYSPLCVIKAKTCWFTQLNTLTVHTAYCLLLCVNNNSCPRDDDEDECWEKSANKQRHTDGRTCGCHDLSSGRIIVKHLMRCMQHAYADRDTRPPFALGPRQVLLLFSDINKVPQHT